MPNLGDVIEFTVSQDGETIKVTARRGEFEGHGEAPATGTLGVDAASFRAMQDLDQKIPR